LLEVCDEWNDQHACLGVVAKCELARAGLAEPEVFSLAGLTAAQAWCTGGSGFG